MCGYRVIQSVRRASVIDLINRRALRSDGGDIGDWWTWVIGFTRLQYYTVTRACLWFFFLLFFRSVFISWPDDLILPPLSLSEHCKYMCHRIWTIEQWKLSKIKKTIRHYSWNLKCFRSSGSTIVTAVFIHQLSVLSFLLLILKLLISLHVCV